MNTGKHETGTLPKPRREHNTNHLPSAVTFFMTRAQRRALLRALRGLSEDRTRALLKLAGLHGEGVSR